MNNFLAISVFPYYIRSPASPLRDPPHVLLPETPKRKLKKRLRGAVSEPARAARLQRIYARLQEGCTVGEIAAFEGLTPPWVRQILNDAGKSKRPEDRPNHDLMQVARLAPALKELVASVTYGETGDVPKLLRVLAQLDRYAENNFRLGAPSAETLGEGSEEHSAAVAREEDAHARASRAGAFLSTPSRPPRPLAVQRRRFYRRRFGAGERDFGGKRLGRRAKTEAGNGERTSGRSRPSAWAPRADAAACG